MEWVDLRLEDVRFESELPTLNSHQPRMDQIRQIQTDLRRTAKSLLKIAGLVGPKNSQIGVFGKVDWRG